jgi:hypothetical protein
LTPPQTTAALRAKSADFDRRALAALREGKVELARELADLAAECEAMAIVFEERGLPSGERRGKVNSEHQPMTDEHRAALSESRKPSGPFLKWIRLPEHGRWSLNRLAAAVGMSPASLSQARLPKSHDNFRPIPRSKATQIEALTGWPATSWSGFTEG